MLPTHLLDPTKKRNERPNHTRLGQPPPPPLPSLCVTGAMSQIGRFEVIRQSSSVTSSNSSNTTSSNTTSATSTSSDERINGDDRQQQQEQQQQEQPVILSYIIFRPRQLHDSNKPPLLCLHGGPSIPSNYLLPIVNGVIDRSVILYDQWGCGKSSRPLVRLPTTTTTTTTSDSNNNNNNSSSRKNGNNTKSLQQQQLPPFSIPTMVEHLHQLVTKCWKIQKFHLLGHSFGGILAFEYLKRQQQQQQQQQCNNNNNNNNDTFPKILSLVLSSTPTSAHLVQTESKRLYHNLQLLMSSESSARSKKTTSTTDHPLGDNKNVDNDDDDDDDDDDETGNSDNDADGTDDDEDNNKVVDTEGFHQTHECRLSQPPLALTDALAQAGPVEWRGIPAISDYEAMGTIHDIPTLLLRGEYDFCTDLCMDGWNDRILQGGGGGRRSSSSSSSSSSEEDRIMVQTMILSNCSHYAMLEDERQYGKAISGFIQDHDTP